MMRSPADEKDPLMVYLWELLIRGRPLFGENKS